jgi:hypothetical protein
MQITGLKIKDSRFKIEVFPSEVGECEVLLYLIIKLVGRLA